MSQIDDETRQMIEMFVAESIDALDVNESFVEDLSRNDADESINTIFRVFHTIKGLSGFVNFPVIHSVTHEAETLLDIFRKQPRSHDESTISKVYSIFDFLRKALNTAGSRYEEDSFSGEAAALTAMIRELIDTLNGMEDEAPAPENAEIKTVQHTTLKPAAEGYSIKELFYEIREQLHRISKGKKEDNPCILKLLRELRSRVAQFEDKELGEYWDNLENLGEAVTGEALIFDESLYLIFSSDISIIQHLIEARPGARDFLFTGTPDTGHGSASIPENEAVPVAEVNEFSVDTPAVQLPSAPAEEESIIASPRPVRNRQRPEQQHNEAHQRLDIRVQTEKLDRLFDLVGEMITLQSMVINNPDLEGMELPNFSKACNMLDKVTRELQEVTMSIRMTPLEGLFNKMKRLVRDTALKMGKQVSLRISGQETEMDKNIIEEIADPLMHILRNAVDHGIENTNERLAAGKEATGTISLSARYEANQIRIDIGDDGAGLNREKILAKAQRQGIIKGAAEKLSEREVYALIFEPGFSTAEQITAVSGRGVGMDVVRKNIEKLHGSVQVESEPGRGTRIILRIPLTLAIMDAMLIGVGDSRYAVPMLAIRESFRPRAEDITVTMDGLEVVRVREELLPVARLHEIFEQKSRVTQLEDGILMIVETSGERACIFVDEIIGQQQAVVKGLSEYIGKVQGVTGCMILSNGEIGLILDIENLLLQTRSPQLGQ